MSFAIIAGVTYDVQTNGTTEEERERIGSVRRAFDGGPRSGVRAEKGHWTLLLAPILPAALATLKTNTALGAIVSCSGDFCGGGSINGVVTIKGCGYFKPTQSAGLYRIPLLDIIEA